MPSKKVFLENGEKYHLFNRGVNKQTVFHDAADYMRFYEYLHYFNTLEPAHDLRHAKAQKNSPDARLVDIQAYALIHNHFHLLVEQIVDDGISNLMRRLGAGYAGYYNEKYKRTGVLFQGKYKRVHINSDEQLHYLRAYINYNHIVHGLAEPEHVYQSSSLHFLGTFTSRIITLNDPDYSHNEQKTLARHIYSERKSRKEELFD